jgi:RNA polymerase sigma factor (sigma-70 family)
MDPDTRIGGVADRFPATSRSAVFATRSENAGERRRAFDSLIAAYWKPVYKYIRIKWRASNEDAKDLTQAFFARALEKEFFQGYDPARALFRTYLRTCLDAFLINERKAAGRLRRGGAAPTVSFDFDAAEGELARTVDASANSPEEYFHREWTRSVFEVALAALQERLTARGRTLPFRLFQLYDLAETGRPTYEEMAAEFGIPATQVTNHLAGVRREFRKIVLEKLRELTATEREFQSEARALLGGRG